MHLTLASTLRIAALLVLGSIIAYVFLQDVPSLQPATSHRPWPWYYYALALLALAWFGKSFIEKFPSKGLQTVAGMGAVGVGLWLAIGMFDTCGQGKPFRAQTQTVQVLATYQPKVNVAADGKSAKLTVVPGHPPLSTIDQRDANRQFRVTSGKGDVKITITGQIDFGRGKFYGPSGNHVGAGRIVMSFGPNGYRTVPIHGWTTRPIYFNGAEVTLLSFEVEDAPASSRGAFFC